MGGKTPDARRGSAMVFPPRDRSPGVHDGVVHHAVARARGGDLQRLQNRHPGGDQGAQRTGESSHRHLQKQATDDRESQEHAVQGQAAARGGAGARQPDPGTAGEEGWKPPVRPQALGEADNQPGGQRQGKIRRGEHLLKGRDHELEEDQQRACGHRHYHRRGRSGRRASCARGGRSFRARRRGAPAPYPARPPPPRRQPC